MRFEINFLPRMTSIGVLALVLVLAILFLAPAQLPVLLLKLTEVSLAGFVGYWIDRAIFPYARPHTFAASEYKQHALGLAMVRRAIIVGACLVAVAVAL